jgi:hypothetical protein
MRRGAMREFQLVALRQPVGLCLFAIATAIFLQLRNILGITQFLSVNAVLTAISSMLHCGAMLL